VTRLNATADSDVTLDPALELLTEAVAGLDDGFVVFDENHKLVFCNPAYQEMYDPIGVTWGPGTSIRQIARDTARFCMGIEEEAEQDRWVAERVAGMGIPRPDREQTMANGRTLLIREHRLASGLVVGVRVDITVQKLKEEELRRAREEALNASLAKSTFLANMSHELRTPLNAIIGFSEIMSNERLGAHADPRYQQYSSDILQSGQHLKSLIDDLLDYSMIESGRVRLTEEPFELNHAVAECARLIRPAAENHYLTVITECPEQSIWLHGDHRAVRQIILNLASNAARYGHADTDIILRLRQSDGMIAIHVLDRGPGIDMAFVRAQQDRPRAAASILSQKNSRGLGLRIVQSLCDLHDARFSLKHREGGGTVAEVLFPADRTLENQSDPVSD
jgi:signal transduction histidine kinase